MSNNSDDETPAAKYMRECNESKATLDAVLANLRAKPLYSVQLCPVVAAANKLAADKIAKQEEKEISNQYTFEDWQNRDTHPPKVASKCYHDWQTYHGFHFDDLYCTKCGQTRPLDPSK